MEMGFAHVGRPAAVSREAQSNKVDHPLTTSTATKPLTMATDSVWLRVRKPTGYQKLIFRRTTISKCIHNAHVALQLAITLRMNAIVRLRRRLVAQVKYTQLALRTQHCPTIVIVVVVMVILVALRVVREKSAKQQQTHAVTLSVATLMLQQKIQTVASVVEHIVLHLITVTMGFTATKQATFVEFQPTS
tara:strand:+ start:187 stop:756 length:570 start_codon:yes stop_codon:yes gene_type:complete